MLKYHSRLDATTISPEPCSLSFPFESLPPELKQAIYHFAATDDLRERDIFVKHTLNTYAEADNGALGILKSQGLLVLQKMRMVSKHTFTEAVDFLASPLFRWVLISDMQFHKFLLRKFRKTVPAQIRERIDYVYLQRFTVLNHTHLPTSDLELWQAQDIRSQPSRNWPIYVDHMSQFANFRWAVMRDVGIGITLLPHVFPALRQFHVSLDIVDCMPISTSLSRCIEEFSQNPVGFWTKTSPILSQLDWLRFNSNIGSIDILVVWDDFCRQQRHICEELTEEVIKNLQQTFIAAMGNLIPAKSIASRC
jgi:hypothetical protein